MSKKSPAEIIAARMARLEEASADLERQAENWTFQNRSLWDIRCHRVELRIAARKYASALRALARVAR